MFCALSRRLDVIGNAALRVALVCVICAPFTAAAAATWRDDLGRQVTLERPPQRVITMLPSLTETVCELGLCARLVATDSYSNWPASVLALPKVGGLDDAAIEAIVALKPDLVVLSRSERTTSRLAALGVATFVIETQTSADVARNIVRIADLLGVSERAAPLNDRRSRAIAAVVEQARLKRPGSGPRVYFEIDSAPYAAGPTSFIGEMLSQLGAINVLAPELGPFPKLNPEYVVRQNPDVIMTLPSAAGRLADRPGWNTIRAVREHRVCVFSAGDRDLITRPGPRMVEGLRVLADCLNRVAP